ncbi:hypothetical protein CC80DRAFT_380684, partial [Byssothecium circinans]
QPRWTRVLKLEPAKPCMPIRCSLMAIDLNDNDHVPYEAISYTWGPYYDEYLEEKTQFWSPGKKMIQCNKVRTNVSHSLWDALRRFRRTDAVRILWADALCINQVNEQEKSQQVSMIHVIFRKAFHVLIWIGN